MLCLYTEKTRFVILNFFTIVLFILKKTVFFVFCNIYLSFLKSETSLSFSSLIGEIFVKTQNFDSYDVIMTSKCPRPITLKLLMIIK